MPDATTATVVVTRLTPVNKGNLRAFVSVDIAGRLKIHGCRVIQQPGQRAWVSLPQQESTGPDGQKRHWPVIEVSDPVKGAIDAAVLAAWQGQSEPDPFPGFDSDEIPEPAGSTR